MSSFDVTIAVVFSLLVFVLGLSFARSGSGVKSFFAAGGEVPWWISGLSLFMSFFSVGTFVVWGSIAYNGGLVSVTIQTTMCIAGFITGFFIAPKWNRTGALTAAEFIRERLGKSTQKFYTLVFLFLSLFSGGAFLYPVGKIVEVTTGIPLSTAILVLGALIIIYTAVGGLWAVLVTDVLQFVVLSAAVAIVVVLAFGEVGGVSGFVSSAPEVFFDLTNDEYTWWFIVAFGFYNMVFIGGNWAYVQRYTSVSSPADAKKVGWLFGSLYIVAPLIWMLPPMIYRVIEPGLDASGSEGAYLMISQAVVPDGLMGLILGAMVFATASSVNTTLNIASGVFTNDVYANVRKGASNTEQMIVARLATVVFGVFSVGVALMVTTMGGIVEVALSLAAITGAALFLPPIWAMFSRAQTGASILTTTISSLAVNFLFKFVLPVSHGISLTRSQEMMVGVLVPVAILLVFEFRCRLGKLENVQYEHYLAARPQRHPAASDQDHAVGAEANRYGRRIIGIGVLAIGLMIGFLGALADDAGVLVTSTGAVIAVLAMLVIPRPWLKFG